MKRDPKKPTKSQIETFEKLVENGEPVATAGEHAGMNFAQLNTYLEQREGGKE